MHLKFNLSKKIIGWYDNNKRVLPWRVPFRSSKKLYYRLLSEFMLQQTQVKTVIPYFLRFVNKIKTLERLSQTNEKQILKYWEGLGYYRRARNLLATSKILVKAGALQMSTFLNTSILLIINIIEYIFFNLKNIQYIYK